MSVKPGATPQPSAEMLEIFRQADEDMAAWRIVQARDRLAARLEAIATAAVTGLAESKQGAEFIASRAVAIAAALIQVLDQTEGGGR